MKRFLPWLNFLGVLALAALCVIQWRRDRALNLEFNTLEKTRQAQEQALAEQKNTAEGLAADLAELKEQWQRHTGDSSLLRSNVIRLERENLQLTADRQELKASVTNWAAAVRERDARLAQASGQLRDLSAKLTDSVRKYNDLATNYNASVQRFNDLATNYNSVVEQLNKARREGK
jgi:chromosome segregation ATPase